MSIAQYLGYSGSGLSRRAREIAREQGAAYVSAVAEHHLSYVRDTVIEEIAVGMEHRGVPREQMQQRCEAIARKLGIEDLLERNPLKLSGGQTRKVTLASVLVLDPHHLVLDDPFAGLDQQSATDLKVLLRELDTTIDLFSTTQHYPDLPVTLIGEDPRRQVEVPTPVRRQAGYALDTTITGRRGTTKKWFRAARTDFSIGPVHLQVPAGGVLWLRGPNGSGKTTLLRTLAERDDCAYLLQDPYDMLLDTRVADMAPEPWLTRFGLDSSAHPFDLAATDLKLATLGHVLGTSRPILLLDEPDVGLDLRGTTLFFDALAAHLESPGAGIVLVTHNATLIDAIRRFTLVNEHTLN